MFLAKLSAELCGFFSSLVVLCVSVIWLNKQKENKQQKKNIPVKTLRYKWTEISKKSSQCLKKVIERPYKILENYC